MELVTRSAASLFSSASFLCVSNLSFPECRRRNLKQNVVRGRRRNDICFDLDANWIHSSLNRARNRGAEVGTSVAVAEEFEISNLNRFEVFDGTPTPFGATARDDGINFAIYSANAVSATLCLMHLSDLQENIVTQEITLDPLTNKTGDVWHVFLKGDFTEMLYGYKFDGKFSPQEGCYFDPSRILLDPYAKAVISRGEFGALGPNDNCWPQMAGMVPTANEKIKNFDWEGDLPLQHAQKDLIIYEMHVRGFTRHESSQSAFPGTYLGLVEKLDYLKELGVNCIELMPCHEFNELEYFSYNSVLGDYKMNFWGYSTVNYFSPMIRYSSAGIGNCGQDAINEFKLLIREAHKRGIEVIMDVVFNHTAEGNENGPTISFRGVDNNVYYMLAPMGEFYNYSGCGNTFNCNHPAVPNSTFNKMQTFGHRYWVTEMHVDGFRFDLASIMTRGSSLWDAVNVYGNPIEGDILTTGSPLGNPPLIDMISNDPVLQGVKLIAEAWDAGGLYQVGTFPHWGVWSEWNGKYRDVVRQFIKGTDGFSGAFAECLCGSPNLYQGGGRKPCNSINFVCAHDGFTLADLVTYNSKHNLANGEDNNDGENHNNSWNCGQGHHILFHRLEQAVFSRLDIALSSKFSYACMGNCGVYGNNIECESLGLNDFPTDERLQWHGHSPGKPDWTEASRFVAFTLVDSVKREVYIAFNASHLPVTVTLPERPGYRWDPLVDTGKNSPFDFLTNDIPERNLAIQQYAHFLDANLYPMLSYSSIILLLSPEEPVSS
uniref:isoamylase n=1 Tax=Cucumis melo TaxID=3656 RepID=A0A9I9DED4_CUCME